MTLLVILGAILVLAGLGGLGYCMSEGLRIRREKPDPATVHTLLQRLVPINLGSVCLAALGLAVVVAGLTLG